MTKIINIETDKYTLAELLAFLRSGDEVIVQEADMPPALLSLDAVNINLQPRRHGPGLFAGKVAMREDFDAELPTSFWLGDEQ